MTENEAEGCSCKKKKCERYGKCSECIAYHKTNKRYTEPYCKRKSSRNTDRAGSRPSN